MGLAVAFIGSVLVCLLGSIAGFLFEPLGQWWLDGYTWVMGLVISIFLVIATFESLGALSEKDEDRGEAVKEVIYIPVGILIGIPAALVVGNLFFTALFSLEAIGLSMRSLPITQSEWLAMSVWNLVVFAGGAMLSFLAGFAVTLFVAWPIEAIYGRVKDAIKK